MKTSGLVLTWTPMFWWCWHKHMQHKLNHVGMIYYLAFSGQRLFCHSLYWDFLPQTWREGYGYNHWGNFSRPFRHYNLQSHFSLNLASGFPCLLCHVFVLVFPLSIISLNFSTCFGCHWSKSRGFVSICKYQPTYGLVYTSKGWNPSNQYQLSSSNHFLDLNIALLHDTQMITFRIHSKITTINIFVTVIS